MNTPRTDAARWRLVCRFDQGGIYDADPRRANDGEWVPVDVCAQLETELATMTALADRLAEALGDLATELRGKAKEALAAYENHKQKTP